MGGPLSHFACTRGHSLHIRHRHTLFLGLPSPSVSAFFSSVPCPPSGFQLGNPQGVGGCAHREKEGLRTHTARNLGLMPAELARGGGKGERRMELGSRKGLQNWLVVAPLLPLEGSQSRELRWAEWPTPDAAGRFPGEADAETEIGTRHISLGSTPRIGTWRREELEAKAGRRGNSTAVLAGRTPQLTPPRELRSPSDFSVWFRVGLEGRASSLR